MITTIGTLRRVVAFMSQHRGVPIPSPALFDKIGQKFRRSVASFAEANGIPWVRFAKEDRKAEVMAPYLKRAAATGRPQVAAIGVAQEFQRVWAAYRRDTRTAAPQFTFAKADRRVTCYYFYLWDADFGPAFIKVCAYFPYPAKIYLLTELRRDLPGRADEREGEGLPSLLVIGSGGERDLAVLVVPQAGTLRA